MTGNIMCDSVMFTSKIINRYLFFILLLLLLAGKAQALDPNKGRILYMQHCNTCHEAGREMAGVPDFINGTSLMQSDMVLLSKIRSGKNAMPGYAGILSDRMILDIVAYMRTF